MLLTRFQKEGKCRIFYVYNLGVLLHGKKSTLPRVVKDSPKYGYFDGVYQRLLACVQLIQLTFLHQNEFMQNEHEFYVHCIYLLLCVHIIVQLFPCRGKEVRLINYFKINPLIDFPGNICKFQKSKELQYTLPRFL